MFSNENISVFVFVCQRKGGGGGEFMLYFSHNLLPKLQTTVILFHVNLCSLHNSQQRE